MLKEKIIEKFDCLGDPEMIDLWNAFCETNNNGDGKAIPVDELDEYYPLSSFSDASDVVQMYSSVMNDAGRYICEYATLGGYGYLVSFDVDDIDKDSLAEAIEDGEIDYRDLPVEITDVLDEAEEKKEEEEK